MNLLIWNIQQLGLAKMDDFEIAGCIVSTIYPAGGAGFVPEIVVIVEVGAGGANIGDVPAGAGAQGLQLLLQNLQLLDGNWQCVPPVCLGAGGRAEAVGVLYRSNLVTFLGPHAWSNYGPVDPTPGTWLAPPWNGLIPGGGAPIAVAAYPAPWNVAPFNGNGALAPQIYFPNGAGAFIDFPAAAFRRPQRTLFAENATGALIDIWAVHPSPSWAAGVSHAMQAVNNVALIPEIAVAPGATDIKIVCGDFNIDASTPGRYAAAYNPFIAFGYVPQMGTAGASSVNPPTPTMFLRLNPVVNGYMSALSVDNAVTWIGGGRAAPALAAIDRVAGAPAAYAHHMAQTVAAIGLLAPGAPQANAFRGWANFGHIGNRQKNGAAVGYRGASDHIPLLLTF